MTSFPVCKNCNLEMVAIVDSFETEDGPENVLVCWKCERCGREE